MTKYKYALSFTGKDRAISEAIFLSLKLKGWAKSTFYYPENTQRTSGLRLKEELPKIYKEETETPIIICSNSYINKEYEFATIELAAIRERLRSNKNFKCIIVMVDDLKPSDLGPEFTDDIVYLKWENRAEVIVNSIVGKINKKEKSNVINQVNESGINIGIIKKFNQKSNS